MNTALKIPDTVPAITRRLQIPDLHQHAPWLLPRLTKAFPHRAERDLISWMTGIIQSNEFMFLYQPRGAALAQIARMHPLASKPSIQEIFVFTNGEDVKEAVEFYTEFIRWAKSQGVETFYGSEFSDVPPDTIKAKLGGRLFNRPGFYARIT